MLFAVLLISSLSLTGIAGISAADVGIAKKQTANNSTVQEKVNIQIKNAKIINETNKTQTKVNNTLKATKTNDTTISVFNNQYTVTSTSTTSQNAEKTGNTVQNTTNANQSSSNTTKTDEVSIPKLDAAARTTKTATITQSAVTPTSFRVTEIKDVVSRVKAYVETNKKLPNYVTIGTTQVKMPDFLKLLTEGLFQLYNGTNNPIAIKNYSAPTNPIDDVTSGNILKAEYLQIANDIKSYMDPTGKTPDYDYQATLGTHLGFQNLIYMFSKILNYQNANNVLPNYVTVKPWSTITVSTSSGSVSTPVPAELQQYLSATANCQVNDASINALAFSLAQGGNGLTEATKIFNWVRDHLGYSFYYNTKYGAVGTLNAGTGNCFDTPHLLVALCRAAGIPARYEHVYAQFSSGSWYGHVIAQVWVNGQWYNADGTSSSNKCGVINNWNTATYYGTYASLPF